MYGDLKDSDRRKNYIILAENSYLDKNMEKAIEFYNKALKFSGEKAENIEILYNMAIIYDELDIPKEAFYRYKKIIELDKYQAGAFYGLATMYERLDKKEKALESYFEAVKIDKEYDRAYFYIANIYDDMGSKSKAIYYYKKVIEIVPDDYIAYNNLASIYEEIEDYGKAYTMIEESIKIKPDYYKALFNMGVIYKKLGNNKKAIDYYNRSLENEKYSYSYLNKSAIYIAEGRFKYCIEILSEGIKYNPYSEYLYYNRACCYSKLNMKDLAIKDLKKAMDLYPKIAEMAIKDKDFNNMKDDEGFKDLFYGKDGFD